MEAGAGMKLFLLALAIMAGLTLSLPHFYPPICAGLGGGCTSP